MVIAGSDSSGGAGIQADIKTITALGSYAMTAITTVTSQNTTGVKDIISINPEYISNQIEYTSKDIKPDAIKIGLLHNEKTVQAVSKSLNKIKIKKVILDPVIVSTSGVKLVNNKYISAIKKKLFKNLSLLTPNIPEAEIISGMNILNVNDMIIAARRILKLGPKNVLIKGGHLKNNYLFDVLINKKFLKIYKNKKIKSRNTHGTGCTLSSAIATYYSCGKDIKSSCYLAIKYVNDAIRTAPNYGKGNGPINHLNNRK
mgnify:FL=1|tara:strand:+ start:1770 stop:2543 length:774 start_codon:yes stop_codon:yes gene_type:complete